MILRFLFGFLRRLFRRGNPNEATARGAAGSTLAEMSAGMRAQAQSVHGEIVALRRAVPTLELVRIASDDRAWLAEPEAAARLKALHEAGFTDGALWSYAGIPNLLGFDLIDATGSVHAAVMRQGTRVILELEQHLADGSVCSVADSEAAKGITSPPWRRPQNRPGTAPEQLIADFLAEARARDGVRGSIEDLRQLGAAAFRRLQAWRAERGGWTLDEIRAQRGLPADAPVTEELQEAQMKVRERWFTVWLRLQPNLAFELEARLGDWICVHDETNRDLLLLQWVAVTGDDGVRSDDFEEGTPPEALERVNRARGEPLVRAAQKTTAPAADFYLPQVRPRIISLTGPFGDALDQGLRRRDLRRSLFGLGDVQLSTRAEAEAVCEAVAYLEAQAELPAERDLKALIRLVTRSAEGSEASQHLRANALDGLERLARRSAGQASS